MKRNTELAYRKHDQTQDGNYNSCYFKYNTIYSAILKITT